MTEQSMTEQQMTEQPTATDQPAAGTRPDASLPETPAAAPGKALSAAAQRALAEAAARKAEIDARAAALASVKELDGRGGLEPVRYSDWEVKGIATDF